MDFNPAATQLADRPMAETFLRTLFGQVIAPDLQLAIFTKPGNYARHFTSVEEAILFAQELAETRNVYFGVGLANRRFGCRSRSTDIGAIVGFWSDIDMASSAHPGKALPATIDQAMSVLEKLPFPPTIIVHSGHGLHAYWLFKESWIFADEAARLAAAKLAKGWHAQVCGVGESLGWKFENTGDLARLLRLPGSFNRMVVGDAVPAVIVAEHLDRRYNVADFEPFAATELNLLEEETDTVALNPDAEPPAEKFAELSLACPTFLQTWNRNRPDLEDQTQSAFDQSLANISALNNWTDQEIANLLIATRRKHNEKIEKALRMDYIVRTIRNARKCAAERSTDGVDLSQFVLGSRTVASPGPLSLRELVDQYPNLRPPVIHGILREGETLNVIAAPKLGKSWLVNDLAICVAAGRPWLGYECVQGDVLILDNELHRETSANRLPKVAKARSVDLETIHDHVFVQNMRGCLKDIFSLETYVRSLTSGRFKLIIMDAFYRFMPRDMNENDNGTMANLYNQIDLYADYLKCAFVMIHHTSKGNQSLKDISDVGAGGGAQSRASDTHCILRRHEEEDVVVMEAVVRTFPQPAKRCLRWNFPVWEPADELDPSMLRPEKLTRARKPKAGEPEHQEPKKRHWTAEEFQERFVTSDPQCADAIIEAAEAEGVAYSRAMILLQRADRKKLVYPWIMPGGRKVGYADTRQPAIPESPMAVEPGKPHEASKRDVLANLLQANPQLSTVEAAQQMGVSEGYVRRIRRQLDGNGHDVQAVQAEQEAEQYRSLSGTVPPEQAEQVPPPCSAFNHW